MQGMHTMAAAKLRAYNTETDVNTTLLIHVVMLWKTDVN